MLRIDKPARILSSEELLRCAIETLPFHEPQIRRRLTMEMAVGTIKTAIGKVNSLIDQRALEDGVK